MRRHLVRASISLSLLAVAATAYSWATYAKWSSSPVTFYVNPANSDVSQSAAIAAMQYAMNVWTNAGSSFKFQYGGTASNTSHGYDNKNVVLFRNTTSGGAIATTYSWWDSNKRLLDSDIIFWDGGFKFYTGTSGCGGIANSAYVEDIAAHEFGHALGLSHTSATDATMYPSYSYCSQAFRTLASDDITGLKALYPGGTSNTAPTLSITSPGNGSSFTAGSTISLSATASDTQDGNLTSQIQWTDNGTAIGSGGLLSKSLSTVGTHVLVAQVTDSGSMTTSKQVTITITAPTNTAPVVTITSPASGTGFVTGTTIGFAAMASDSQDGNLTSKIQWTDNGAALGSGGLVSKALTTLGTHTIVAKVTDNGGMQGSAQVSITITASNTAPTLTLTSPVSGGSYVQNKALSFTASASDGQDGNVTSKIQWTDNGVLIGSGGSLSKVMSTLGTHTIVAKVTDSGGLQTSKQVSITVVNTAPTVTITNPLQGAFIPKGKQLDFTAAATDIQDGNLGSKIQWTDNGVSMGTGATLSRNITTVGTHVIAAKVTDNGGMQKTAQITITVTATR